MADIDTTTWSETAASNNASPADGWPEGQSYASVNNCAREMMGALKRDWNRSHGTIANGGTSTALTLAFTTAPGAYVQGLQVAWRAAADCGASPTLNVNALGAKALKRLGPLGLVALGAADIRTGQIVKAVYDSSADAMIVLSPDPRVGWRLMQTQNFAAAATLAFALSTSFTKFRLIVTGALRSGGNATNLGVQCSTDGGSTYYAAYSVSGIVPAAADGGSVITSAQTGSTTARVFADFNANNALNAEIDISIISGEFRTHAAASGARYNGGTPYFSFQSSGSIATTVVGTPNFLRITWSDGGNFLAQGSASLYAYNEGV